jgi:hypothetical protein
MSANDIENSEKESAYQAYHCFEKVCKVEIHELDYLKGPVNNMSEKADLGNLLHIWMVKLSVGNSPNHGVEWIIIHRLFSRSS